MAGDTRLYEQFEPKERVLHLAYGGGGKSATAKPLTKLELGPLFDRK